MVSGTTASRSLAAQSSRWPRASSWIRPLDQSFPFAPHRFSFTGISNHIGFLERNSIVFVAIEIPYEQSVCTPKFGSYFFFAQHVPRKPQISVPWLFSAAGRRLTTIQQSQSSIVIVTRALFFFFFFSFRVRFGNTALNIIVKKKIIIFYNQYVVDFDNR